MKEKKKVHAGLCVTDERIVGVTAHIENKTMVITDALEMKRTGSIDEDVAKFIETYDLDDREYSIVADIKTQMHMAAYDPHDFDVKEFIKWNVDDYFDFGGDCFQMDACRREYPRHNYYMFMVAVDRHDLELLKQGIRDTYAPVDVIDGWPIPICYSYMQRSGIITGIVEPEGMHLWAWWKDVSVQDLIVPITESDIKEAIIRLEEKLQQFGVDEIKGVHFYGTEELTTEEYCELNSIVDMYSDIEYIPLLLLGRGRNRCQIGCLDWDMAIGMAARGLKWIGQGW